MRLLIDAQLPRRLAYHLRDAGHDAVHTLDLPLGNRTPDADLIALAAADDRVIVTKDGDFASHRALAGVPRLLHVAVGNCSNAELEQLLLSQLDAIEKAFGSVGFVELTRSVLVLRP